MMLYSGEEVEDRAEDEKFDKLMSNFDRVQKQLSQQQQALSHLVKRVNNLIERREKKEKAIKAKREGLPLEPEEGGILSQAKTSKRTEDKLNSLAGQSFIGATSVSVKPSNLKGKKGKKKEDESDEELSKEKLRQKKEQERDEIEAKYINANEEHDTENIEKLTRIAGKYKKDAKFGTFKSKALADVQSEDDATVTIDSADQDSQGSGSGGQESGEEESKES